MDSDNSNQTVVNTLSSFNNSDIETLFKLNDEFPLIFFQPTFQPIASQFPDDTSPLPSSYIDTTTTLF